MTAPKTIEKRKITPEDIYDMQFVGDPQISPDGDMVAFVVTDVEREKNGYSSTIWVAEIDDPDSVRQFTHPVMDDNPVRDRCPRWSPDGSELAFISNRGGSTRIWRIGRNGGEAKPIGDFSGPVGNLTWSSDNSRLAFTASEIEEDEPNCCADDDCDETESADVYVTERLRYKYNGRGLMEDEQRRHIWVVDVDSDETIQLTNSDFDDGSPSWSSDGEKILFTSSRRPEEEMYYVSDLYEVPADGGDSKRLTDGEGSVSHPRMSPDGACIAFFGNSRGSEIAVNTELCLYADGERTSLTEELDRSVGNSVGTDVRFDAGGAQPIWCHDGESIVFSLTDGGVSRLYETDLEGNCRKLTENPAVVTSYSVNQQGTPVIAYVGADWDSPGDLWVMRSGEEPVKFTNFNDWLLAEEVNLSRPERVTFTGAEGWEIEGWIMKPVDYCEGEEYPLVLEIHGGPAGTSGEVFFQEYQLLAASGWGVMFTNPRGSRGYGERHLKGVIGDWGGNDYRDLMGAADYASNLRWVDEDRLGVTGGSYGGYMTNWIVSQTDRFSAAVTFRSISNLYTKYGCSDIGFYSNRRGMGGADLWESEDFIMSRSAIRHAPNVSTPILIVHAEEDYRCPMEQAEQWYVALKRLGVECRFVRYADENHELSRSGKPHNRVDRLRRMLDWFDDHI